MIVLKCCKSWGFITSAPLNIYFNLWISHFLQITTLLSLVSVVVTSNIVFRGKLFKSREVVIGNIGCWGSMVEKGYSLCSCDYILLKKILIILIFSCLLLTFTIQQFPKSISEKFLKILYMDLFRLLHIKTLSRCWGRDKFWKLARNSASIEKEYHKSL